jgi:hypothetical protein
MFVVEEVIKRGWLRDSVRIVATEAIDHVERGIGLDHTGGPGAWEERLTVARGEAFEVRLPRALAAPGRLLTLADVAKAPGLRERWTGWEL